MKNLVGFLFFFLAFTSSYLLNAQSSLTRHFTDYEIVEFNTDQLLKQAKLSDSYFQWDFKLSEKYQWSLDVLPVEIFSDNYKLKIGKQEAKSRDEINDLPVVLKGFDRENAARTATITVNKGFLYGMIRHRNQSIYFEPLSSFDNRASNNQFVVYKDSDVIHREGNFCAAMELEERSNAIEFVEKENNHGFRAGACLEVDYAIANDHNVYDSRGSGTANWNAGVVANVNTDYDDTFNDEIRFVIVETYISTQASQDLWGTTNDFGDLLDNFTSWAPGGFSNTHDLGGLWTKGSYGTSTIGLAWVGVVCGSFRYHVLKDYSNNANSLRNLVSHEIGHNFSLPHVSESNKIMTGTVSGTSDWASSSISQMNSYYPNRSCLTECEGQSGGQPTADFGASFISECSPTLVQMLDESTGNPTSWSWQFEDGSPSTSSQQNPQIEFPGGGNYGVTLTVTNENGSDTETKTMNLNVSEGPNANFSYSINGYEVNFDNNSSDASSYYWTFGDGTNSNSVNPTHTYSEPGTYTVTLLAENDCGEDDFVRVVVIEDAVFANFNTEITNVCVDQDIQFFDQSDGNVISYFWEFEGGNPSTSTLQNPVVSWNNTGSFNVKLTVESSTSSDSKTITNYISVKETPNTQFSYSIDGKTVSFDNNTVGGTEFFWSFGDGNTSTSANPTHEYNEYGQYEVVLTVGNYCGEDDKLRVVVLEAPLIASFETNTENVCVGSRVDFSSTSSGDIVAYDWEFEGGNPSTSTFENPSILYEEEGRFNVRLTVTSQSGNTSTIFESNYINADLVPEANFSYTQNLFELNFENLSNVTSNSLWIFGDGNSSNYVHPSHTYSEEGEYTVRLRVSNECDVDEKSIVIPVYDALLANFNSDKNEICPGETILFTDLSSGNPSTWNWTFEGSTTPNSFDQNPSVVYNEPGMYDVRLTIADDQEENSILLEDWIEVKALPQAGFEVEKEELTVSFINLSENATTYIWDFGDGSSSQESNPTHTYSEEGNYLVSLNATNECGTSEYSFEIGAFVQLIAGFGSTSTQICEGTEIQFFNESNGEATQFIWSFPGGTPSQSTEVNPIVIYESPGDYGVSLTVTNDSEESLIEELEYVKVKAIPDIGFVSEANEYMVHFEPTGILGEQYYWDFGTGENSSDLAPSYEFNAEGYYDVMFVSSNECGADTSTNELTIQGILSANFEAIKTEVCIDESVRFNNRSTKNAVAWSWEFPGAEPAISSEPNPIVSYKNSGVYPVTLTVNSMFDEQTISFEQYIKVNDNPEADFSYEVSRDTVSFLNLSKDADSYNWSFDGRLFSDEQNPIYIFPEEKIYSIGLEAKNACSESEIVKEINLYSESTFANFIVESEKYCLGDTLQLLDYSSEDITSWHWQFPNSSVAESFEQNPKVVFEEYGIYDVILTVSNGFNTRTIEKQGFIEIINKPVAEFDLEIIGNRVEIQNFSEFGSLMEWDMGDGTKLKADLDEYVYKRNGIYTIKLSVENACGAATQSEELTIDAYPTAGFTLDFAQGCTPLEVNFENRSSENAQQISWILEGFEAEFLEENPSVIYDFPGHFDVILIASNEYGSDSIKLENLIKVSESPESNIEYEIDEEMVTFFTDLENYDELVWDFGDGNFSNEFNPSHIYEEPGVYTVVYYTRVGDCEEEQIFDIEVSFSTFTTETEIDKYSQIFPNPAQSSFTIEYKGDKELKQIRTFDLMGKYVSDYDWENGQTNLTIPTAYLYQPGHYFIEFVFQNDKSQFRKLIVIK